MVDEGGHEVRAAADVGHVTRVVLVGDVVKLPYEQEALSEYREVGADVDAGREVLREAVRVLVVDGTNRQEVSENPDLRGLLGGLFLFVCGRRGQGGGA